MWQHFQMVFLLTVGCHHLVFYAYMKFHFFFLFIPMNLFCRRKKKNRFAVAVAFLSQFQCYWFVVPNRYVFFIKSGIFFSCSEARCESQNIVFNCSKICSSSTKRKKKRCNRKSK